MAVNKNRIGYADIAKCVAIFLVLWGHAITQLKDHDLASNHVHMWIYSFHMPLFMMVSGFFAGSSMKLGLKDLCVKKFQQLILPALSFGLIWYVHDVVIGVRPLSLGGFAYLEAECFWFLKCLFFAYIIAWLTYRITPPVGYQQVTQ